MNLTSLSPWKSRRIPLIIGDIIAMILSIALALASIPILQVLIGD